MLRPNSSHIWRSALRIAATFLVAEVAFALVITLAPRVFPRTFRFHAGISAYFVLGGFALLVGLAVVVLAQLYVRNVSIQVLPGAFVVSDFRRSRHPLALDGLWFAERVPVAFKWYFVNLRWNFVVLMGRTGTCVQTLDKGEWPEPAMEQVLNQLRVSGIAVQGDWGGKPHGLVSGFGRRYPGAAKLRGGPYSLVAVSLAVLIYCAAVLASLPFSLG